MRKLFFLFNIALVCSCGNPAEDEHIQSADTVEAPPTVLPKDRVGANLGTWRAEVHSGKGKSGTLKVSGHVHTGDPKAKVTLGQKQPTDAASTELVLVISKEPTAGKEDAQVSFEKELSDVSKYQKVSIVYGEKQVAVIDKIERSK